MRKFFGVVFVLSMCIATGWTTFGKEVEMPNSMVERSSITVPGREKEQKREIEGKDQEENHRRVKYETIKVEHAAMKEKWNSLTASQKNQIYQIQDQINTLKAQKVDKLAEFGVIDHETQAQLKERIKEGNKAMKAAGKMPLGSR